VPGGRPNAEPGGGRAAVPRSGAALLLATLNLPADDPDRYTWERVQPGDRDHMPPGRRLLHVLTDRARWQAALTEARRRAEAGADLPAIGRAA
jgi:hypothetical protein